MASQSSRPSSLLAIKNDPIVPYNCQQSEVKGKCQLRINWEWDTNENLKFQFSPAYKDCLMKIVKNLQRMGPINRRECVCARCLVASGSIGRTVDEKWGQEDACNMMVLRGTHRGMHDGQKGLIAVRTSIALMIDHTDRVAIEHHPNCSPCWPCKLCFACLLQL